MRLLVPLMLLVSACATTDATAAPQAGPDGPPVTLSISLYVVDDVADASSLSSRRTTAELENIAARMNDIWAQAGIALSIQTVDRIAVPANLLEDLAAGDTSRFLEAAARGSFPVPDPAIINGFYVRRIGSANGLTPLGTRVFFVADEPTVHDERVSSHEVGHILGLHHARGDDQRLMFSGTNGMTLTPDEIAVARYVAAGILDGVR